MYIYILRVVFVEQDSGEKLPPNQIKPREDGEAN